MHIYSFRPRNELTEIARRRLAALKEFSDLGAGFKIAALDLELRGAGNMLGGQQSGHIEAVGFELYTSMLEAAVKEMKGESSEERPTTQLNLGIALRIDESYVAEENQRLRLYKKIAGAPARRQSPRCARRWKTATARCPMHRVPAGGRAAAPGVRAHGHRADRPQARRSAGSFHGKCNRRPAALDAAGCEKRQAWRAVHAAGIIEVSTRPPLRPDEVLLEIHELLENLAPAPVGA